MEELTKELTKNRTCNFCGKELTCKCFYHDYGIACLDSSGRTYSEFDACPDCLLKIVDVVNKRKIEA